MYIFPFFKIYPKRYLLFNFLLLTTLIKKVSIFYELEVVEYHEFNIRILYITENMC